MKYSRIICIDPSLTCSGWALFSISTGSLLGIGKIRSLPATHNLSDRLNDLQERISELFIELKLNPKDILICEAATTIIDPSSLIKLEQVRGIFETLARANKILVPGRLNPNAVHREVLGMKGKQLDRVTIKSMAVYAVEKLYSRHLKALNFNHDLANLKKNQDIVDAILLGHVALARVNTSYSTGIALQDLFTVRAEEKRRGSARYKAMIAEEV